MKNKIVLFLFLFLVFKLSRSFLFWFAHWKIEFSNRTTYILITNKLIKEWKTHTHVHINIQNKKNCSELRPVNWIKLLLLLNINWKKEENKKKKQTKTWNESKFSVKKEKIRFFVTLGYFEGIRICIHTHWININNWRHFHSPLSNSKTTILPFQLRTLVYSTEKAIIQYPLWSRLNYQDTID